MAALFTRNAWYTGLVTNVSGTPVQINDNTELFEGITVVAPSSNLGTIFIGNSGGQFFPLTPNAGCTLHIDKPSLVYCVSESGFVQNLAWYGS